MGEPSPARGQSEAMQQHQRTMPRGLGRRRRRSRMGEEKSALYGARFSADKGAGHRLCQHNGGIGHGLVIMDGIDKVVGIARPHVAGHGAAGL